MHYLSPWSDHIVDADVPRGKGGSDGTFGPAGMELPEAVGSCTCRRTCKKACFQPMHCFNVPKIHRVPVTMEMMGTMKGVHR